MHKRQSSVSATSDSSEYSGGPSEFSMTPCKDGSHFFMKRRDVRQANQHAAALAEEPVVRSGQRHKPATQREQRAREFAKKLAGFVERPAKEPLAEQPAKKPKKPRPARPTAFDIADAFARPFTGSFAADKEWSDFVEVLFAVVKGKLGQNIYIDLKNFVPFSLFESILKIVRFLQKRKSSKRPGVQHRAVRRLSWCRCVTRALMSTKSTCPCST